MSIRTLPLWIACVLSQYATTTSGQITYPGTLDDLKAEVARRVEFGRHPVEGYDPADIREGLASLRSKSEDDWAAAWMAVGDRYFARARSEEQNDPEAALGDYQSAYSLFALARWPSPTSEKKHEAYRKGLEAFYAWDQLTELPTEVIEIPFEGTPVVGLLRLPAPGSAPAPLLVQLSGLDGYKENGAMGGALRLARRGVAVLGLDSPGSAPQTVRASPDAWRALVAVLERVTERPDIDRTRVALRGGSWGGYWAATLALQAPERFVGVVSQGAPIHRGFDAKWPAAVVEAGEYLFDFPIALQHAFEGVTSMEQLEAKWPTMSLETLGLLGKPTPPMLLVNGMLDQVAPVEDLFLMLRHGTAKEAWINPQGIHMGREHGIWDNARINNEVILPWLFRRLGLPPPH